MNQSQYNALPKIIMGAHVDRKSKPEENDNALVPVLSDMSSIMTVTSLDSLDVLSPRGTPMKQWFNCFYPSATKGVEVEYNDVDELEPLVPLTISSLPPVAEVLGHAADTDYNQQVIGHVDCDTNSPCTTKGELEEQGQEYNTTVLEGLVEEYAVIVESSFVETTMLEQDDDTESHMSTAETGEDEVISSVDFLFAFVWVVISLWLLKGYTLSPDDIRCISSTVMDMIAHLAPSTTVVVPIQEFVADGFIHTTQLFNAVVGESVCSILGSSCIA